MQYQGYDALQPFRRAVEQIPSYTPNWHGMAALHRATQLILDGPAAGLRAPEKIALYTRQRIADCGLALFPARTPFLPTVTAVSVPDGVQWADLDNRFREKAWWWAAATVRCPERSSAGARARRLAGTWSSRRWT